MPHETEPPARYLFIVARSRPDILAQVRDRLRGDGRIEVIADRRYADRRKFAAHHEPERRRAERRRPAKSWDDLTRFPTLVVQKQVPSYTELQRVVDSTSAEVQELREENLRLRSEAANLQKQLEALVLADVAFKADALATLAQAEEAVTALIQRFRKIVAG
jgi:hypothetical protein